jgi:simple sugar transport system permease protein
VALAVAALALGLAALALALGGFDPWIALGALASGAMGDERRIGLTLLRAAPLVLTGLGVAVAFRAGLWNIGAEGQLLAGAIVATWAGTTPAVAGAPGGALWVLAAGAVGGAAYGLIPGTLRAVAAVPEVIVTILLNFVALETLSWLVQGPLQEAAGRYPQTEALAAGAWLGSFAGVPAALVLGIAAALALHVWLHRTRAGFAVRVTGANAEAANAAGIRVPLLAIAVFALSGALSGAAGAAEVQGSIHRLYEGYQPGYGFTAIAVALLARLEPLWILPAALFFGALSAGSDRMEALAGVPSVVAAVVQALVVLGSVVAGRRPAGER